MAAPNNMRSAAHSAPGPTLWVSFCAAICHTARTASEPVRRLKLGEGESPSEELLAMARRRDERTHHGLPPLRESPCARSPPKGELASTKGDPSVPLPRFSHRWMLKPLILGEGRWERHGLGDSSERLVRGVRGDRASEPDGVRGERPFELDGETSFEPDGDTSSRSSQPLIAQVTTSSMLFAPWRAATRLLRSALRCAAAVETKGMSSRAAVLCARGDRPSGASLQ